MRKIILGIVLGWSGLVHAQELVFTTPIQLTSVINSNDEELAPMLSPDGNTLYFIRTFHDANIGGKFAGTDIWMSRKDDQGQWMQASRMDNVWNNKRSNAVIGINSEQSVVYLLNGYTNKSGIAFSKFFGGQWGQPEFIPISGINRDDFVGFYVTPEFDVILISMKGEDTLGEEDLYISLKESSGNWTEPRNLGPTLNTSGFEISPFLSKDKKRLYFSSNGHPGFGDADVFYSERLYDSWTVWSKPQNLGSSINSHNFDAYFSVNDTIAHFTSSRIGNQSDIFVSFVKPKKDTIQQKVKEIISQAKTIITDLNTSAGNVSVRLEFLQKSIEMNPQGQILLSRVIEDCEKFKLQEITILAYSSEYATGQENSAISEKRIKKVLESIRARLGATIKVNTQLNVDSTNDSKGYIEIRYSFK